MRNYNAAKSRFSAKHLPLVIALLLLSAIVAGATGTTTYRDAQGRSAGTATTHGNTTTYRDAQGRTIGTATTNGGTTTYRDAQGRTTGTSR